jgi:hypothetical protein
MSLLLELNCLNEFSSRLSSSYRAKTDITVHASKIIIVTGMTDDTEFGCRHLTYSDPVITSAGVLFEQDYISQIDHRVEFE